MAIRKYPIGTQTFKILRELDYIYVDKTEYVYNLTHGDSRVLFLSRPRRFGKSLLLSTIESYFSGDKSLFKGLKICELEKEWNSYPVLRFDFAGAQAYETETLKSFIDLRIKTFAKKYDVEIDCDPDNVGNAFGALIESIAEKTGKKIVILIDEYDKGIIEVLDEVDKLKKNQYLLRSFFSQLKAQDSNLRFAMLTGVSPFQHLTIFSGFNNLKDISLLPQFAAICGFSKSEMLSNFDLGIKKISTEMYLSIEETFDLLRLKYDGYRFTKSDVKVFNPYSIINCLSDAEFGNYWLKSGTSKVFFEYLIKTNFDITTIDDIWVDVTRMEGTYSAEDPVPLLYKTGYLTIKDYDGGLYRLGIPNGEVRDALVHDTIPYYMGVKETALGVTLWRIRKMVNSGDAEGFLRELQTMIACVPYHEIDVENIEKTYHLIIYLIFMMLDIDAHCEIAMSGGRIDMVVKTSHNIYVMEFKLGGTADEALCQIDDRGYALPWSADSRRLYKIGIVFSPKTRTLSSWKIV